MNMEVYAKNPDWKKAIRVLSDPDTRVFYLWGRPGTGKTYSAYDTTPDGKEFYSVTLTPETPASELRGHWLPKGGGEFVFHEGPAIRAMRGGHRLVINEISHAGADVLALMYVILESEETAAITLPTGETIRKTPGMQVILTDNCPPDQLTDALQDRIESIVKVDTYNPVGVKKLGGVFQEIVQQCHNTGNEGRWVSLRGWMALERKVMGGWDLKEACQVTFGDAAGDQLYSTLVSKCLAEKVETFRKAQSGVGKAPELPKAVDLSGERILEVIREATAGKR